MTMIQAINAQKIIERLEYTAVHDIRQAPETVGFSFEIVQDATDTIIAPTFGHLQNQYGRPLLVPGQKFT